MINQFYHRGAESAMDILELESKVAEIRGRPLQVIGITSTGKARTMTVRECWKTKSKFLHVADDELDALLGAELGGDKEF